jgi:hypothetical protein
MAEHVDFNLDDLDRESAEVRQPFAFTVGGQRFTLTDPADLDWKDRLEIDDPVAFFRYCMPEDQKPAFKALDLPGWKLGKLIEQFQRHYGIGKRGNARASSI